MIFEIETAIKAKLNEITRFEAVYNHFTLETDWYPYAAFEFSWFDWNMLSVCTNERGLIWNIIVLQSVEKKKWTRNEAKNIIYKCIEDIITKLDWDQDLWEWTIVRWEVSKWELWTIAWKEWSVMALNVEVSFTILTVADTSA